MRLAAPRCRQGVLGQPVQAMVKMGAAANVPAAQAGVVELKEARELPEEVTVVVFLRAHLHSLDTNLDGR